VYNESVTELPTKEMTSQKTPKAKRWESLAK